MTASVTMRMCVACRARFGVLVRAMAPNRESRLTPTGDRPQRRAAAPLPRLDASRLRCGSACPRTDPSARTSRPWVEPPTCARGCRRGSRSYPQFRCTNLTPSCAPTLAVNSPSGQPASSSLTVTAARPLAFRSSRTPGRASMVSRCPRCMLTMDPAWAASMFFRTAAAPGSV